MIKKVAKFLPLLCLTILFNLGVNKVSAEQQCITYRDYYFFNQVGVADGYLSKTYPYTRTYTTSFSPRIDSSADFSTFSDTVTVHLNKIGKNTDTEMDIAEFFGLFKKAIQSRNNNEIYTEKQSDTLIYRYIAHEGVINEEGLAETSITLMNIDDIRLQLASIMPSSTKIKLTFTTDLGSAEGQVTRTLEEGDVIEDGKIFGEPFDLKWSNGTYPSLVTPALAYVEYQGDCTEIEDPDPPIEDPDPPIEDPTYKANIQYINKDTNEKVSNDYNKTDLKDGYSEKVNSPTLDNCTLVNADEDVVNVLIEGKDFNKIVYYTCSVEPDEPNKPTGDILIAIVWGVGIAALGYSAYYFNKMRKENI